MIPNIDTETANLHGAAVKDKLQAAAPATKEAGAAIASDLKSRAADAVGAARNAVADRAGHMADAVSDAGVRLADKVKGEGFPARALHLAAGGLSDAAKGLSGQSLAALLADTRAFAQRNPALFVLGAAAAGFALMRLMKTGDSDSSDHASVRPMMRNQPGSAS